MDTSQRGAFKDERRSQIGQKNVPVGHRAAIISPQRPLKSAWLQLILGVRWPEAPKPVNRRRMTLSEFGSCQGSLAPRSHLEANNPQPGCFGPKTARWLEDWDGLSATGFRMKQVFM
ncbi:hypothetical protein O181_052296 [Austropuccinia psidii MF-1]|uniref:Uncharacterized protein n=1 Tax=Austropuccinia psidii MF-1 TaxID=1389203 RepID=A0A9Q3DY32_9BASI|nr:hypothetical protein [Austropuccinia psidii MF-1]